jgi:hypothetical protein
MEQASFGLAMAMKPLALLMFLGFLLLCRYVVIWFMPDCAIKRLLLLRV